MSHDFLIPVVDTDSITVCKKNGDPFTEIEIEALTDEINSLTERLISWEFEFYVPKMIILKSKNYIIYDPSNKKKPITIKGSAIKATNKEPALKEYIKETIQIILDNKEEAIIHSKCLELYNQYVEEIMNISDIYRWASKKTITDKILKNERANESKVRDALVGSDYVEGDKIFVYFKEDETICLVENFKNDHDRARLLEKLKKTSDTFQTILPTKELFVNYSLKKQYKILLDKITIQNVG